MNRSVVCAAALILAALPVSAEEPQELAKAACVDLLAHLPEVWPPHVAEGAAAAFEVSAFKNRSSLQDVSRRELLVAARAALEGSPRLTQSENETPTLVVVGALYGSAEKPWGAVMLCDAAKNTILAVGLAHRQPPQEAQALAGLLKTRAAEGWPEGIPLAASGKPVLRVHQFSNLSSRRDLDLQGLVLGLNAALVRSGVVEVGVPRVGDAMQAIESLRERRTARVDVEEERVGLVATGWVEGGDEPGVRITVFSASDRSVVVQVPSAPAGSETDRTPPPRPSPSARPSPSPAFDASTPLYEAGRHVADGRYVEAIEICESLLVREDPYVEGAVRVLLADIYCGQGQLERAIEEYTRVLERTQFPLPEAYEGRARALIELAGAVRDSGARKRHAQAALRDVAASLDSSFGAEGLHLRALAHALLGDDEAARADDRLALAEFERHYDPEYEDPDEEEPDWVTSARERTGIVRGTAPDPPEAPVQSSYFFRQRVSAQWKAGDASVEMTSAYVFQQQRDVWLVLLSAPGEPDPRHFRPTTLAPGATCVVLMMRKEWGTGARQVQPLSGAEAYRDGFAGRPEPLPEHAVAVAFTNSTAAPVLLQELLDVKTWDWPAVAGKGSLEVEAQVHSPTGWPEIHTSARFELEFPGGGRLTGSASVHLRNR